jgi:hypothetical protein
MNSSGARLAAEAYVSQPEAVASLIKRAAG